jgi:hypothetical protein
VDSSASNSRQRLLRILFAMFGRGRFIESHALDVATDSALFISITIFRLDERLSWSHNCSILDAALSSRQSASLAAGIIRLTILVIHR